MKVIPYKRGTRDRAAPLTACKQSIINDQGMRSAGRKGLSVSVRGLRVRMSPAGMAESQPGMQCWSLKSSKLFLFCPSNLTAPNKSHNPPLVIPSAAEGPAVRPGSRTKVPVLLVLPQNRHPGQSASQIDDAVGERTERRSLCGSRGAPQVPRLRSG